MTPSFAQKSEADISGLGLPARALWHAANGHWDTAHELVQNDPSPQAAWIHAYLHRVEGDLSNARYWYHQAGKKPAMEITLEEELNVLIQSLCGGDT